MSFRSIILNLHESEAVEAVVRAAMAVGESRRSHLIGVHNCPMTMHQTSIPYYLPQDILEIISINDKARADKVQEQFAKICSSIEFPTAWHLYQGAAGSGTRNLIDHALSADLIVVSQDIRQKNPLLLRDLLQRTATPILVTPVEPSKPLRLGQINIAWNGSMQTVRAIRDAMQLLEKADFVRVVCTGRESKQTEGEIAGSDIATWLSYHDISVTLDEHSEHRLKSGADIVQDAQDGGADLLVMGGYGHSPLYDAFVGGMTDDVMINSQIPVFLSH